jgi:predicted transcriptional regulator
MSQDKSKTTERKGYNTTLRKDLMKRLRVLAAQLDKKQNDLIEEAILTYLNKHEKKLNG